MADQSAIVQAIRDMDAADVESVVRLLAEDCVYHEDPHWLDGRRFEGRGEIRGILSEYTELWGTTSQTVEWVESEGEAVLAGIRQQGETPQGRMPIDQLWTTYSARTAMRLSKCGPLRTNRRRGAGRLNFVARARDRSAFGGESG